MEQGRQLPFSYKQVVLILLLVLLTFMVLAQANPILKVPGRDNGTYLYLGSQILKGKLPYRDAWESKPPAIFYVNALGLYIGKGSRLGVWLLEFITIFAAGLISYFSLHKRWGAPPALFGLLVWYYGLFRTLEGGNLTEEYSLPFAFLGSLAFVLSLEQPGNRFPDLLIGMTFAASFLFRPNNAIIQSAIVLTQILLSLIKRRYQLLFLRLGTMAAGALIIFAIPVLYYWQKGLLQELYYAAIGFNVIYSETPIASHLNPLRSGFMLLGVSAWIALLGFVLSLVLMVYSYGKDRSLDEITLFMTIGWLAIIPFSDPANRGYTHYFMNWLPLIALSSAALFSILQTKLPIIAKLRTSSETLDMGALLILVVVIFITSRIGTSYLRSFDRLLGHNGLISGRRSTLSMYINKNTSPGELVFFWGGYPNENFMAQRDAPTPYLYYPLYLESDLSNRINDSFLQSFTTQKPILIVDMNYTRALSFDAEVRAAQLASGVDIFRLPKNFDRVCAFIEENYYLEEIVSGKKIYRLNGTGQR